MTLIEIIGEIDQAMPERVHRQLADADDHLRLIVGSQGGDYDAASQIYEAIRQHPARLKTAFIGEASSGALLIALAADRRVAVRDASILLHVASQAPTDSRRWTAREYFAAARRLRRIDEEIAAMFSRRTGRPASVFLKEMKSETEAPLAWCLQNKIIHEVM